MNSFARVMKTGLDGTVIWKYDFTMYQDPIRNLVSFNITKNIGGDGYVICGAINDDTLDYSNNLKPFTFEIDDFGNFRTFHEYSFLSFKGAALKIVNTDDGQYAMTGMIGDQFDTLTSNERMGFLTQLDANFNVIWWQHFASSYSRTMSPSNAPRFDWANEVISFKRPGDQNDVYFVGGAQTKETDYVINPKKVPHNTQGWLFDNLGNIIWTVNECLEFNTISTAIYDTEDNTIYAGTNAQNGGAGVHNHILKIDAVTGNILDRIEFEGYGTNSACEASGHAMSITNLKIEGDYIYVMGYNGKIEVYGNPLKTDVYDPFISKLDKNNLRSWAYKSYIWDDNTQNYPTAHPSIVGILGYQYPQSFGDYLDAGANSVYFSGHLSYNPRAFIKNGDKLYFLSYDNTHTSPLWDLVLKTNENSDYCHTQEWVYEPKLEEAKEPIISSKYSPSWTSDRFEPIISEPFFDYSHCSSLDCVYPSGYFKTRNTKEELKSENFKNITVQDLLKDLSSNEKAKDYYIVIYDITGKLIYSNQNYPTFNYNYMTSGLYVISKIYPSNPSLNSNFKLIKN